MYPHDGSGRASNLLIVLVLGPEIKVRVLGRLRKLVIVDKVRSDLDSTFGRSHEELLLGQWQVKPRSVVGVVRALHTNITMPLAHVRP